MTKQSAENKVGPWRRVRTRIRRLVGQPPGGRVVVGTDRLVRDWPFRPSRPDALSKAVQLWRSRHRTAFPDHRAITPIRPRRRWALYFIYAPDGHLRPSHRFAMRQLRSGDTGLLVVFASCSPEQVSDELRACTDALYWKALPGMDFSGYAVGLHALAEHSPGSDVLVMNDSVYGPLCPMDEIWSLMKWDLTGFTASGTIQNHIQSYAFMLRGWDAGKLRALGRLLRRDAAYNDYRDVIFCQETRLAQWASQTMSVGAQWYAPHDQCSDPSLWAGLSLVRAGFPFLKKSLFTKYANLFDQQDARDALAAASYPFAPD